MSWQTSWNALGADFSVSNNLSACGKRLKILVNRIWYQVQQCHNCQVGLPRIPHVADVLLSCRGDANPAIDPSLLAGNCAGARMRAVCGLPALAGSLRQRLRLPL